MNWTMIVVVLTVVQFYRKEYREYIFSLGEAHLF